MQSESGRKETWIIVCQNASSVATLCTACNCPLYKATERHIKEKFQNLYFDVTELCRWVYFRGSVVPSRKGSASFFTHEDCEKFVRHFRNKCPEITDDLNCMQRRQTVYINNHLPLIRVKRGWLFIKLL